MTRPTAPTGRAKRIRISMKCHTGIEPLGRFWDYFSGIRRGLRPEYLRVCLFLGFRFGRPERSEWPAPDGSGKKETLVVEFLADHPCLGSFYKKYASEEAWDKNTRWVLKTIILGHEFLSGKGLEKIEKETRPAMDESKEIPASPQSAEDPIGGLFS
ncbi:MAG: hypothetical protein C75L2_00020057 [Leptospirillum sp. Group II 'C75']|nr:hypothetical protein ABH19_02420 [Leptospirillum sp. Group II 'CF-1']EIJ75159.1 MAG: hypothetical protein C75L2_00020057 [Leptospirillum sp. Group II 'C75']